MSVYIQPGDRVLLYVPGTPGPEELALSKQALDELYPGVQFQIVSVAGGGGPATTLAVYRDCPLITLPAEVDG